MRLAPTAVAAVLLTLMLDSPVDAQSAYQKPPKQVSDILAVPPPPAVSVSPTKETLALVHSARYPAIEEVAEPMLRLAGLRINPQTTGPARTQRVTGITFVPLNGDSRVEVKLPEGKVSSPIWSHHGKQFAVTVTKPDGISLWLGQVSDGSLREVKDLKLNAAVGGAVQWLSGNELLVKAIPNGRGKPPEPPLAPVGPVVQEAGGKAAPVRTYQDLLENSHDEALFEYYATSQPTIVWPERSEGGPLVPVGEPGIYTGIEISPDGKYFLVTRIKKPFSYLYPMSAFPKSIEVWDRGGKLVHTVADLPLQNQVPIEGVPTGPRSVRWVPTEPATLMWVDALDEGDPKKKVPFRDQSFKLPASFAGQPQEWWKTEHRFSGATFFENGTTLLTDYDRERKWTRTVLASTEGGENTAAPVVFDRSVNDRYNNPGSPELKSLPNGERVLLTNPDGKLFLTSAGSSPKGDFPTLKLFDPKTQESTTLFQSRDGLYESVAEVLDNTGNRLLIRRESTTEPTNYFLKEGDKETKLTDNKDPFPELRQVKKQLVTTKRADGVTISFTLYTPPGVKDGEKLPTVFWAYPREFNDPSTAGQVSGSPHRFTTVGGYSHLFFLTQGYAVMDEVSMPIVGQPEVANDTFIDQLVMNAKAAIDKACEIGPIDRDRIGIGGHSYGAFMTANLLAHSDLFRAGIARSGAYNRTLTPFGFQNERRTFWEAADVYGKMSPFFAANKVNEPLLLIHGQADSNPGTFPVQSERMYQAVRGNGGVVRLVMLPHEDHGYSAKESIEHVLAEQIGWFDKHVKSAKPRATAGSGEK